MTDERIELTERIEYKLLSLTYKVLTTTQHSYLHNLIIVQPPRSTRSSSLVTLARLSTSSSLRIVIYMDFPDCLLLLLSISVFLLFSFFLCFLHFFSCR